MAGTKTSTAKTDANAKAAGKDDVAMPGPDAAPAVKSDAIKMKDFIGLVTAELAGSKKTTRDVVAATLTVLGNTLKAGESFSLPPLGRGRVVKVADGVITMKLRQGSPVKADGDATKEPLAATQE